MAVLAVAEIGAAVYVVRDNGSSDTAAATPRSTTPVTTTSRSPSPSLGIDGSSTSNTAVPGATGPVIAFLGDDWTLGTGATRKAKRFTTLACGRLGAQELNFGIDGAGYAKAGPDGATYAARIDRIVAADPAVVVVSGGRNDRFDSPETAAAAARQLFARLHARLPDAVLIAIAPFWGDSDLPPEIVDLAAAVEAGVTAAGGTYLDVADPIHGHPDFMADAADPNNQGYAAIATTLAARLEPLLPG